jgi:predicted nucleic acid-binding Zn ribbon protein
MRKRNEQSIGEIIRQYLKVTQLDNVVFSERISAIWQETLGQEVTRETDNIFLQNGYLFVSLRSPALKTELMMRRTAIARALNEKLGTDVIKSVVIR